MPVYEYECTKCNKRFEVFQKITDAPLTKCDCGEGELKKLISNTSFVLKGSGWYATDYPSADRKKAIESEKTVSTEKKKTSDKPEKKDSPKDKPVAAAKD